MKQLHPQKLFVEMEYRDVAAFKSPLMIFHCPSDFFISA